MPFLVALLVIALIIAFLFLSTLFIVPQQQAYIIERFGKFNKVQFAGIHIRIPFVDRIAMKTNMRVNQLNVQLETKTLQGVRHGRRLHPVPCESGERCHRLL